jgi:hypothetical protein
MHRIPLGDNLLEITASLPENDLTAVLRDFRQYRPPTQREYIESIEARARLAKVKLFAYGDPKSLALYVLNVDQVGNNTTSTPFIAECLLILMLSDSRVQKSSLVFY